MTRTVDEILKTALQEVVAETGIVIRSLDVEWMHRHGCVSTVAGVTITAAEVIPVALDSSIALPEGMRCGDCSRYNTCRAANLVVVESNTVCVYDPSQFTVGS